MVHKVISFILLLSISGCGAAVLQKKEPVDYVNNRIGNISILLMPTYPVTHLPNSMLRMIPGHADFVTDRIQGLPMNVPMHRQGDVLRLMPYCGDQSGLNPEWQYRYDQEKSTPYSYSVWLDDFSIVAEFTPAARSGIYSFTFENDDLRFIMLRTVNNGKIHAKGKVMSGYENYRGVKHYFYLEFEQAPQQTGDMNTEKRAVCYARFGRDMDKVRLRYGISYISEEQAKKNLENEIAGFDLNKVAQRARDIWNRTLGKIEVEGGTEDQKTTFYTALYRAHERMINISEDGRYYSGFDRKIHDDEGIPFWTDDWVWDTFLALHPLQTILAPSEQEQKLASYIRMYEQSDEKWMPTFPCVYGDAHCMNGNHAAGVFLDALNKNLKFDLEKAFEGMKNTVLTETMIPWRRAPKTELDDFYHQNGWFPALPSDEEETFDIVSKVELRQAVAVTQAASYDDWCIAHLAEALGKTEDYDFFINRSYNYRNLFNRETGFFHPKDKDGKFLEPFDYKLSGGYGSRAYYDENNAWTYIWDVHHNIADLINLFGGNKPFIEKLDQLFVEDMGRARWLYYASHPDATGNIGQYVAGNEPSFHIPYLYNYAGEPWKTQKRIRMIMESWFRNDLMGIPGDEDGGGMTAYYVFSAMGFYPVTTGIPAYNIGSPVFEKITIHLENGKTFTIKANGSSWSNKYIQSAKLNGKPLNIPWFTHEDIVNGGVLELEMNNRPNKKWGTSLISKTAKQLQGN
ncbi:MAG: GH92 family glycosyl hydrolase [Dysgonamonadaceae bacterium]|jgi:predicted alpha-1,2-mannosidase|nr:GH92 family glycosyl hydrolase [Dysgonamonadaceae bacterium]